MGSVNFYNQKRELIIQFTDFIPVDTEVLQLCTFRCKINFDFFNADATFQVEKSDLNTFKDLLSKMYLGRQRYITFNPLGENIVIRFSLVDSKIEVKCDVDNDLTTCRLAFEYEIDQTFIPELVEELDYVLEII